MSIYKSLVKPLLFTLDAETAHSFTIKCLHRANSLGILTKSTALTDPTLKVSFGGIEFPNPVGLAAGCDKAGEAIPAWPSFGFGFVEIGTITGEPQPGNPKPRAFRLPQDDAVINRMGFNSEGSEAVAERMKILKARKPILASPLIINIGKTKVVTEENAVLEDYRKSLRLLAPYADIIAVNVSSPNTPGLRLWQEKGPLKSLLSSIMQEAIASVNARGETPPVLVKISPDMSAHDMVDVLEVAVELQLAGVIATNTTISRSDSLHSSAAKVAETGGLSGRPLKERANEVMRFLFRESGGRLPLIGVGGISSAEDAYERIRSGASLVQVYTGLIFEGPYLPRTINQGLVALLQRDRLKSINDAVGIDCR